MKKILKKAAKKIAVVDRLLKAVVAGLVKHGDKPSILQTVNREASGVAAIFTEEKTPAAVRAKRAAYEWCYNFQIFLLKTRGLEKTARERRFHALSVFGPAYKGGKKEGQHKIAGNKNKVIAYALGWGDSLNDGEKNRVKAISWAITRRARTYAKTYDKPMPEAGGRPRVAVPVTVLVDTTREGLQINNPAHLAVLAGRFPVGDVKAAIVDLQKNVMAERKRIADAEAKKKADARKAASEEAIRAAS